MQTPNFYETKKLEVNFHTTIYGLIEFTITIGDESFENNFSEVFDPIINFQKWLEAICNGVEQCSFSFDPEGDEIRFSLERIGYEQAIFTISSAYDISDIFLSGYVDRFQLVKEFYFGVLNFYNSPKFRKYQWQGEPFAERLGNLLDMNYETLLTDLSKLGRKQLNDFLCKADPRHWRVDPSREEESALAEQLKSELLKGPKTFVRKAGESEIRWNIPLDYSNWSVDEKRKLVTECLSENCSWNNGTKIDDFKSRIIETFLRESPENVDCNIE